MNQCRVRFIQTGTAQFQPTLMIATTGVGEIRKTILSFNRLLLLSTESITVSKVYHENFLEQLVQTVRTKSVSSTPNFRETHCWRIEHAILPLCPAVFACVQTPRLVQWAYTRDCTGSVITHTVANCSVRADLSLLRGRDLESRTRTASASYDGPVSRRYSRFGHHRRVDVATPGGLQWLTKTNRQKTTTHRDHCRRRYGT